MNVPSISPQEAHALLINEEGCIYLDVRSVEEFGDGHPAQALNLPLLHRSPAGQMVPNADFLRVALANFPTDSQLLVGCFSGHRSMKAASLLLEAGYRKVANVRCGFGGARDGAGRIVEPGWSGLGLPVEREARPGTSYEQLKARAGV